MTPDLDVHAYALEHGIAFVAKRQSWLMRAIAWLLGLISRDRKEAFLHRQWTTIGPSTVYVPSRHEATPFGADIIQPSCVHELTHARDARRWPLLWQLSYLLLPLPVGLALFRAHWEAKAYATGCKWWPEKYDIEPVVDLIWSVYLYPAPKRFIRWRLVREMAKLPPRMPAVLPPRPRKTNVVKQVFTHALRK